jgi:replicative DNA helicase
MIANDSTDQLEASVIGAVILRNENLALLPSIETDHFRSPKARATWEAIRNLEADGRAIDVTTIGDELARVGKLDAIGWETLGLYALRVPTTDNAIEYAHRLKDTALRVRLMESLAEIIEDGKRGVDGAEMLSRTLGVAAAFDADRPDGVKHVGNITHARMKQLEQFARERASGIRTLTGHPTGVAKLDEKIGGWQPGIVSIVAARPGMGKSSLGLATADVASQTIGVHLFSLEDTESSYADRVLSRKSGVAAERMRNSELERGDIPRITQAVMRANNQTRWLVDGRSGISATEIVRSVRRKLRDNGTKIVIVDYVQLVAAPRGTSRHEVLSEIVTTFADAAKQDNIAYVVMSQLNRELEKRTDKRPQLSDLRESGSLEERAKCVVALYRGSVYGPPQKGVDYASNEPMPTQREFDETIQLLVLKNSNGRTGAIRARWNGPTTTVE